MGDSSQARGRKAKKKSISAIITKTNLDPDSAVFDQEMPSINSNKNEKKKPKQIAPKKSKKTINQSDTDKTDTKSDKKSKKAKTGEKKERGAKKTLTTLAKDLHIPVKRKNLKSGSDKKEQRVKPFVTTKVKEELKQTFNQLGRLLISLN